MSADARHTQDMNTDPSRPDPLPPEAEYTVRAVTGDDANHVEVIWSASQDADYPLFRPHDGWWSLVSWAAAARLLLVDGSPIGVAAIHGEAGAETAEGWLALLPTARYASAALHLVDLLLDLAREAGCTRLHLYTSARATWAISAAEQRLFSLYHAFHMMLRPADAQPLSAPGAIDGIHIRQLRAGEEPLLLEALNRAWATTWNFRPIPSEALLADLQGQREGFFVAVEQADDAHIVGTVHAIFDPAAHNPDEQPYAWISNLTVDPTYRKHGLGRTLLTSGINHLAAKGAGSVVLGVDGAALVPMALYRSVGFESISTTQIWEHLDVDGAKRSR